MSKKINVEMYDDFLDENIFMMLESLIITPGKLQLYIQDGVSRTGEKDSYLSHIVYQDNEVYSDNPYSFIKQYIFPKLDVAVFLRSKINCYPRTHEVREHSLHVDFPFPHKTALLSINTCDGYTLLEDGEKLNSVKNRLVVFDGNVEHASTTCSDEPYRFNIIFNYITHEQLNGWK